MSHVISSLSASTVPTIVRSPVQPFDSQSDKRTFDTRKEFTDEKKGGTRTAPDKGKENNKKRKVRGDRVKLKNVIDGTSDSFQGELVLTNKG